MNLRAMPTGATRVGKVEEEKRKNWILDKLDSEVGKLMGITRNGSDGKTRGPIKNATGGLTDRRPETDRAIAGRPHMGNRIWLKYTERYGRVTPYGSVVHEKAVAANLEVGKSTLIVFSQTLLTPYIVIRLKLNPL